jgi:hypothetical protein
VVAWGNSGYYYPLFGQCGNIKLIYPLDILPSQEGSAFSHCTTCKALFHLRVEAIEDDLCRRLKFRLFVARDVFLVFLAMQAVRYPFSLITLSFILHSCAGT